MSSYIDIKFLNLLSTRLEKFKRKSENKLLNEIRGVRTQLDQRDGLLEKWRWLTIGGSIIIGLMISNPDSMLMQMF